MKQFLVMALAATAVVGCSKRATYTETDEPGQALNIVTTIESQTESKAVVEGSTMPQGSAIGVHLADGTNSYQDFTPSKTDGGAYTSGRNVRFSNESSANVWASVDADGNSKVLYFKGSESAKVFAYHPYASDDNLVSDGEYTMVKVPLVLTGTIDANTQTGGVQVATSEDEKDYMWSTTQNTVGAATTATAKLTMKHALARVAFRIYTAKGAQQAVAGETGSYYRLDGYTIKNRTSGDDLKLLGDAMMNLSDGTITPGSAGGQLERTITNYKMVQSNDDYGTVAANQSKKVGNLIYPISITNDGTSSTEIEVVFHIARVGQTGSASAAIGYAIPFDARTVQQWEAGKSYTYTVKFTGSSLTIETVTVTPWSETTGGDMEIG